MLTSTQLTAASTGNWLFQFLRQWSSAAGISLVLAGLPLCSLLVHSPPTLSAKILPESFIWCHFLSHFPFPHSFSYDVLISSYSLMVLSGRLWEVAEIKCVQSATPHWGHSWPFSYSSDRHQHRHFWWPRSVPFQEWILPEDIWPYLFLAVAMHSEAECYWQLLGGGQGGCQTPCNAGNSPYHKERSGPTVNRAEIEKLY